MRKLLCSLALTLLIPTIATAQRPDAGALGAKGYFLGVALNASSYNDKDSDDDAESGGGLSFSTGWGFNPNLALFLELTGAMIDVDGQDFALGHVDLGVRYHFAGPGRKFIPFLDVAVEAISAGTDDLVVSESPRRVAELEATGSGFTLGAGFNYFFGPRVSLMTNLRWTSAELNKVRVDNVTVDGFDIDLRSSRVNVGLVWFLGKERRGQ